MKNQNQRIIFENKVVVEGITTDIVQKIVNAIITQKIKKISVTPNKEGKKFVEICNDLGKSINNLADIIKNHPEIEKNIISNL